MGRHSAPETEEEGLEPPVAPVPSAPTAPSAQSVGVTQRLPSPRPPDPARPRPPEAASASAPTAPTAPVTAGVPESALAPEPTPAAGTRGDLQLLRSDTGLLLWCVGSVVLLFLVYTSVLIVLGRTDVYLIWLWVPTVLSGITIGGLLDRAHRAVAARDRSAP